MQNCRCGRPLAGRCGELAVSFSAGMITALLLVTGKAVFPVALVIGGFGAVLLCQNGRCKR